MELRRIWGRLELGRREKPLERYVGVLGVGLAGETRHVPAHPVRELEKLLHILLQPQTALLQTPQRILSCSHPLFGSGLLSQHTGKRQEVSDITQRFIDRNGDADREEQWQVSSKHNE